MEKCAGDTGAHAIARQGSGVLQQRTAIFAAVLALGLIDVGAAHAQGFFFGPRFYDAGLPPHEVMRIVRSTGLAPMTRPVRRGPYYVVVATNRAGGQMRVVVDAYGGEIVRINPMLVAGLYPPVGAPYDPPPRVVNVPPEIPAPGYGPSYGPSARFDDGVPPVPPRSVPSARIATAPNAGAAPSTAAAPPHTAALPARTPMPRPRPGVAKNEAPSAEPATLQATAPAAAPVPVPPAVSAPVQDAPAAKSEPTQMIPVAPLE
jgi:hypothetical protein